MDGPITVRRGSWHLRGPGWVWECTEHKRHGYHADLTRQDHRRKSLGYPVLKAHAWVRCINGAVMHYHRYHAPTHTCCIPKTAKGKG